MSDPAMTTDIFIKTCQYDADYHRYCLESIAKYCTGFRNTVVVDGEHPRGYLHQQVVKMHADEHCPGADFILVTDSDTLFTQPVTPESFMVDGKPVWVVTPFAELMSHDGTRHWHGVVTRFFGVEPVYETMRRQPFVFPSGLLVKLREYCFWKHGRTLEQYIMENGSFSEWNVAGNFAWMFHRDEFHWIDTSTDPLPELRVRQFWSHDPLENNLSEIQDILT
jgi:hypothetical protein